jgi:rare lipoprotein A
VEPTPAPPPEAPVLEGIASWYGPDFHGKKTASGERFDQEAMTAAHATLAFGTRVRVTNLDNGRSIEVVINDRPGRTDRIIDLSKAAGRALGLIGPGTAQVRLAILDAGR